MAATSFHPLDGTRHVRALGHERLARLVAYHSSARWEAERLVVQCLHCAHDYLAGTVERTEERIWAAGGRA